MVAAHVWDTIGAQSVGFSAALITRPGNAPLPSTACRSRRSSQPICANSPSSWLGV